MGVRHEEKAAAATDEAAATAKKSGGGGGGIIKTTSVPAHVLQRFWDLASTDPETRCATAAALSEELRAIQNEEEEEEEHGGGGGGGGGAMTSRRAGPGGGIFHETTDARSRVRKSRRETRIRGRVYVRVDAARCHRGGRWISIPEGRIRTDHEKHERNGSERYFDRPTVRERGVGESVDCERCVARSEEKEEKRDEEL